jgi:hypothetical protein
MKKGLECRKNRVKILPALAVGRGRTSSVPPY